MCIHTPPGRHALIFFLVPFPSLFLSHREKYRVTLKHAEGNVNNIYFFKKPPQCETMQLFTFMSCSEVSFLVRVWRSRANVALHHSDRKQTSTTGERVPRDGEGSRGEPPTFKPGCSDVGSDYKNQLLVCLRRCCTQIVPVWMSLCLQLRTTADAGEEGEHYRDPRQNNPAPRAIQYPVQNYAETIT